MLCQLGAVELLHLQPLYLLSSGSGTGTDSLPEPPSCSAVNPKPVAALSAFCSCQDRKSAEQDRAAAFRAPSAKFR